MPPRRPRRRSWSSTPTAASSAPTGPWRSVAGYAHRRADRPDVRRSRRPERRRGRARELRAARRAASSTTTTSTPIGAGRRRDARLTRCTASRSAASTRASRASSPSGDRSASPTASRTSSGRLTTRAGRPAGRVATHRPRTPPTGTAPMNLKEAARRLGVHYQTAYRWVRSGELVAVRIGSALRDLRCRDRTAPGTAPRPRYAPASRRCRAAATSSSPSCTKMADGPMLDVEPDGGPPEPSDRGVDRRPVRGRTAVSEARDRVEVASCFEPDSQRLPLLAGAMTATMRTAGPRRGTSDAHRLRRATSCSSPTSPRSCSASGSPASSTSSSTTCASSG